MDLLMEHLKNGLVLALLLSAPIVVTTALIGITMGILQAVTQIHEQTLTAAPKIVASFLILILLGGFMMTMIQNYFFESIHVAFIEVPQLTKAVLPPKTMVSAEQKRRQAFFGSDYPTMHDTELQKVKDIPSALNRQQSHKGVPVINGGPPNKPKPGVAEYLYMRDRARSEQR